MTLLPSRVSKKNIKDAYRRKNQYNTFSKPRVHDNLWYQQQLTQFDFSIFTQSSSLHIGPARGILDVEL